MFAVSKRDLLKVTNFNPSPGSYYQPLNYNSRSTDFNLRAPTQKRMSVPQYQNRSPPTFPLLLPQKQLHGYARPRDRVEFNKRHPKIRNSQLNEGLPLVQTRLIDDDYDDKIPNFTFVKPRALGGLMNPVSKNYQKFQEPNNFDPLLDEVIQGVSIASKETNEKAQKRESIVESKFLNQSSNYVDASTFQQSDILEQKELRKEIIQNQHIYKRKNIHHKNIINDSLEALLLRDKYRGSDELPGPGQYLDINKLSSFKKKNTNKQQDSLNTRSKKSSKTQDQYHTQSYRQYYDSFVSDFDKIQKGIQFDRMIGRDKQQKSQITPPVGKYNISTNFIQKDEYNAVSIDFPSAFGSGQKRFS